MGAQCWMASGVKELVGEKYFSRSQWLFLAQITSVQSLEVWYKGEDENED